MSLGLMGQLTASWEQRGGAELRIYHSPEGFMHWCTKCGACLESKSKAGIFRRIDRHAVMCKRRAA